MVTDGHGDDNVTHKQILSGSQGTNVTPLLRLDITQRFCSLNVFKESLLDLKVLGD